VPAPCNRALRPQGPRPRLGIVPVGGVHPSLRACPATTPAAFIGLEADGARTKPRMAQRFSGRPGRPVPAERGGSWRARVAASTTMQKADWSNTTVLGSNLAEQITKLKSEIDGQIGVGGSAALVRSLLAEKLLGELHLLVFPLTLGGDGARLLPSGPTAERFEAHQLADTCQRRDPPRPRGRLTGDRRRGRCCSCPLLISDASCHSEGEAYPQPPRPLLDPVRDYLCAARCAVLSSFRVDGEPQQVGRPLPGGNGAPAGQWKDRAAVGGQSSTRPPGSRSSSTTPTTRCTGGIRGRAEDSTDGRARSMTR
jgi:RibD C-terminal domain